MVAADQKVLRQDVVGSKVLQQDTVGANVGFRNALEGQESSQPPCQILKVGVHQYLEQVAEAVLAMEEPMEVAVYRKPGKGCSREAGTVAAVAARGNSLAQTVDKQEAGSCCNFCCSCQ